MKIEINIPKFNDRAKIEQPLADFRPPIDLPTFKLRSSDTIKNCIAVGISPRDNVLNQDFHQTINNRIKHIFTRRQIPFTIVGEWSPEKHRWHYHGFCKIPNLTKLDSLKRSISRQIGRIETENIRDEPAYIDYMVKCYETPYINNTIQPWKLDSYTTTQLLVMQHHS